MLGRARRRRQCKGCPVTAVLFRADANSRRATGHVMRCLAFAEALREAGQDCHFACAALTGSLRARLADAGFSVHDIAAAPGGAEDASATLDAAGAVAARGLVVDGYHFDASYRARLRGEARRVLAFDDIAVAGQLHADIVVNASSGAAALPYGRIAPGAKLLLGPDYAVLRRDIRDRIPEPAPAIGQRTAILVSFGGADPLALTGPCMAALARNLDRGCTLDVVVGGGDRLGDDLERAASGFDGRVNVHRDSRDMGALMNRAGMAVSAGGTTVNELAALGVPFVLAITADNQAAAAGESAAAGFCQVVDACAGDAVLSIVQSALELWRNPARRVVMGERGREIVDGRGADRVCAAFREEMEL